MEFIIPKNQIKENIGIAMRMVGYHKISQEANGELNYAKPLNQAGYPRFHIYLRENKTEYVFSLHLDQKRPVYKGARAHSGEYAGQIIQEEAERIRQKLL